MPQFENIAILGRILRTTIDVISRRTSDAYANVIIGNAIKDLAKKYNFLDYVKIQGTQYTEVFDVIDIGTEINNVDLKEIGKAANEFLENIIGSMGKNAGYYFLKEIKENMPSEYGAIIKEIGVDLDFLQLKFLAELKQFSRLQIKNSEMLRNFTKILFDILDKDYGRTAAFITLNELVGRLGTEYETLRYVQINDIRSVQGVDIVTINSDVDKADSSEVGAAIQRIVQELNNYYADKGGFNLIEKLKNQLSSDYIFQLEMIGINLEVIQLKKELVIKHVIIALIDALSRSSNPSSSIMVVNDVIKKFQERFEFLNKIKIDSEQFSKGNDGVVVSPEIEDVNSSELGRGIQKVVEDLTISLGEEAGENFIEIFKKRLGKAYVLRIEEMGVNLHMMELKRNLTW
ncbi:MAG: hypothetical protein KAH91_00310 [Thermoplasmatales archaeon]|nr:hypothetical protein [Thermoplasmatales archaeon]